MKQLDRSRLTTIFKALQAANVVLTLPQLLVLLAVGKHPGMSVNELADEIDVPQQTASRYVALLQGRYAMPGDTRMTFAKKPALSLEVSQTDPRRRALYLTGYGRDLLMRLSEGIYCIRDATRDD